MKLLEKFAGVIILITWLILKFSLKSKDVLHQVSNYLGDINSFYSSLSDTSQKGSLPFFQKFKKVSQA